MSLYVVLELIWRYQVCLWEVLCSPLPWPANFEIRESIIRRERKLLC